MEGKMPDESKKECACGGKGYFDDIIFTHSFKDGRVVTKTIRTPCVLCNNEEKKNGRE
jgi:hypothetical protein